MKQSEAADLLTFCAFFDQRTVGVGDAVAWANVLSDVRAEDAQEAIRGWYAAHRERIMPADIIVGVRKVRAARLERHGDPVIDVDPDDTEGYKRALTEARRRIADGEQLPTVAHGELTARPVDALTMGKSVPVDDPLRAERRALLRQAANARREQVGAEAAARAEHLARVEAARAELDAKRSTADV